MQTTLLGFAIALILALLAALVGPHFVHWNDHRAFFDAEASRMMGVAVRVEGDIDATILPVPSVTLRQIAIVSGSEANRLQARSLRIDLSLGSLMRGELRAAEMHLVAPELNIGLDRAGRVNWPPLAIAAETLSIDVLRIEDGRAVLTDAASGSRLVIDRLDFAGEVRSLTGPFHGQGEFVVSGRRYGYDFSAGRQSADGTRVKLSLRDDERPVTIAAQGMLAFNSASPRFDGVVTLSRPAGAVSAGGKAMAYEPWRLSSKIVADPSAAALDEISFQFGPDERAVALAGSASFKFGVTPLLRGKLVARQIDFDRLLATPKAPRHLPFSALRVLGEMVSSAMGPAWPIALSFQVDAATLGGAGLQRIAADLRSDGANWTLDRLEMRAPGFSNVKLQGKLYRVGNGLGFAGDTDIDSSDPKALLAWATGSTISAKQITRWRASGDITLAPDRIAAEGLNTEFQGSTVTGSLAYAWPTGDRAARLDADLRATELDLDALLSSGRTALSGLGLDAPREFALGLDIGRARLMGLQAQDVKARLSFDPQGLAIDRLSIGDLGDIRVNASGRIQSLTTPASHMTVDIDARDLTNVLALAEKITPSLAEPLRSLATGQRTAKLRATVGVSSDGDNANGTLGLSGNVGAVRVNVSARASGKRKAFVMANLNVLADTDLRFGGVLESDEGDRLLALVGLGRVPAADKRSGRLTLSASGPLSGDLRVEGRLDAGPIDVAGKGILKHFTDRPALLDLNQVAGTIGGNKVGGRLAFRFGEAPLVDGSIEADTLNVPATVAAVMGMPNSREQISVSGAWSTEPFVRSMPRLAGQIAFKAQRATFLPEVVVQNLNGVAHVGRSEIVFENVAGELAKGRLEARLAFASGANGLSARLNAGLTDVEIGTIFSASGRPAIKGRLSLQTELEGAGRSPAAFVGSLAGFGRLMLEQVELAGFNPGMFGAVTQAVDQGSAIDGRRIRELITGTLDETALPLSQAKATVSVNAGRARFSDIVLSSTAASLQATAGLDLTDGTLDAVLTFTDMSVPAGAAPPSILVALKGPLFAPKRAVDAGLLTSWLTLRAVERQAKQIDALERARREAASPQPEKPIKSANDNPATAPAKIGNSAGPAASSSQIEATGGLPKARRAPVLPPPMYIRPR